MAQAGYCAVCQSNVWLRTDGSCANGHAASCVSNAYEAGIPTAVPAPVRKRLIWTRVVRVIAVLLLLWLVVLGGVFWLIFGPPSMTDILIWCSAVFFVVFVALPIQVLWLKFRRFLYAHDLDWFDWLDG